MDSMNKGSKDTGEAGEAPQQGAPLPELTLDDEALLEEFDAALDPEVLLGAAAVKPPEELQPTATKPKKKGKKSAEPKSAEQQKAESAEKAQKAIDAALAAGAELGTIRPEEIRVTNTIPGLLVRLFVSVPHEGYTTREVVSYEEDEDGRRVEEEIKVVRVVIDKGEKDQAESIGQKIRRTVKTFCANTQLGMICPERNQKDLFRAIAAAHAMAAKFNKDSKTCSIRVAHHAGRIGGSDKEIVSSLNQAMAAMLEQIRHVRMLDDIDVLNMAKPKDLKPYKKVSDVLEKASSHERTMIVARVRARISRDALKELQQFTLVLPEEPSLALGKAISSLRTQMAAQVAAAKESEEAYDEALKGFDSSIISSFQATLIEEANKAESIWQAQLKTDAGLEEEATSLVAPGEQLPMPLDLDMPLDDAAGDDLI